MSLETFLLTSKSVNAGPGVRRVSSRAALKEVVESRHGASNWIVEPKCLEWFHQFRMQTRDDSLLLLGLPRRTQAPILHARFRKVWGADDGISLLPQDELYDAIASENKDDLFVGGVVDKDEKVVLLLRGNLTFIEAAFDDFPPSGSAKPNFAKFAVVEYGTAVAFGDYLATADSILYRCDAKYRKNAKARRLKLDKSLGGSLKRLRMLRGLSQADFEPEVSAKQIARIEAGQTKNPQEDTMRALAKRLRVKLGDIHTY